MLSAGGYHHHVGLNTWAAGAALAEPDDAAQTLPNGDALATDPWRTTVRLTLG